MIWRRAAGLSSSSFVLGARLGQRLDRLRCEREDRSRRLLRALAG
jgi:hypothetical protein